MLRRFRSADIAHLLDADDASEIVAAGFDFSGCREDGDAAGSARRFVAHGGDAVELRFGEREEAAEMALSVEELASEVADMAGFNVFCCEMRRVEAVRERIGERVGDRPAFAGPVLREITLPAAENVDHRLALKRRCASAPI